MRMPAPLRALRDRLVAGARILLYHRVAALDSDPQWLAVRPGNFDGQMEVLSREANVVERSAALGLDLLGTMPDQFAAFQRAEIVKWGQVIKAANVHVD